MAKALADGAQRGGGGEKPERLRKDGGGQVHLMKWQQPLAAQFLAVAASLLLSGCDLFGLGGAKDDDRSPRIIDEQQGSYGQIGFGSSGAEIRAAFGEPGGGDGFYPLGADSYRGPPSIKAPGGTRTLLRYGEVAFLVSPRVGLYALTVTRPDAATLRGVAVGDPLDAVRANYERVTCGKAVAGEPIFGGDVPTYSWCRAQVGRSSVFFGDDPIRSVTLTPSR
jgi:hypothetical protein